MDGLLRWVARLWLGGVALVLVALLTGRVLHAPPLLQALGYGLCAGEPCFRGLTLGMGWDAVADITPYKPHQEAGIVPIHRDNVSHVRLVPSIRTGTIASITLELEDKAAPVPYAVGDLIIAYGRPCRIDILFGGNLPGMLILHFPKLVAFASPGVATGHRGGRDAMHLSPYFQLVELWQIENRMSGYGVCDARTRWQWRGFASVHTYVR